MVVPLSGLAKRSECEKCSFGGGAVALLVLSRCLTGEAPEAVQSAKTPVKQPWITTGFFF